jgi:hypothetical protein
MTDTIETNVRGRALRLAALGAAAGVLLALVFGLGALTRGPAEPLPPDERLGEWRHISADQKEATARQLLDIWKQDGTITPRIAQELADPERAQQLVNELVAGLDEANNHKSSEYVPPGESIRRTGRGVVITKGWDK